MAVDTLTALVAAVDRVLVVSDQPSLEARLRRLGLSVAVTPEPGRVGMNGALSHGDSMLRASGCASVLACVGDVPALLLVVAALWYLFPKSRQEALRV